MMSSIKSAIGHNTTQHKQHTHTITTIKAAATCAGQAKSKTLKVLPKVKLINGKTKSETKTKNGQCKSRLERQAEPE